MTDALDIYRTAQMVIDKYGDGAEMEAIIAYSESGAGDAVNMAGRRGYIQASDVVLNPVSYIADLVDRAILQITAVDPF